jgi:predicted transcriptional regulator
MLKVMQEKKLIERVDGEAGTRGSKWKAKVSRKLAARGFVSKMIERIFDGSAQQLVAHIINDRELSDADRAAIQQLLDQTPEDKT